MVDTRDFVLKQIEERNIHFIRLWFSDVLGNLKSFAVTPSEMENAFEGGMGFDGSSVAGFAHVQDPDLLVIPDASTFQVLPWRPKDNGVARMFCDVRRPNGEACDADSRHILMNAMRRAADCGYSATVAADLEYFYFRDSSSPDPIDRGGYFDLTPLDNASDLRRDTVLTLEQVGVPVAYSHHEAAPSQHGIDLRAADPLSAADSVMTARLVVREVATAQGVHASFMPKPLEAENGSGMHIQLSLFDADGDNVFAGESSDGPGLSNEAEGFIAGILRYAPEFMLVTNQYVNSYKRLVPGRAVPLSASWGNSSRSTLVRVPPHAPASPQSACVELRSADSAANPYLAIALMLSAGVRGIEEGLALCAPAPAELAVLPCARRDADAPVLPLTLGQAIDAFEQSSFAAEVLGEHVRDYLLCEKRREWEAYRSHVSTWELERYLPVL